jgi:hypothetical protein
MHGGSRDKLTKLRHNVPALQALSKRCDRSHAHEPWGGAALWRGLELRDRAGDRLPSPPLRAHRAHPGVRVPR